MDLRHAMMTYHWPGNVRELENYTRKLMIMRNPDELTQELQARARRKPLVTADPTGTSPEIAKKIAAAPQPGAPAPVLEQVTKAKQQAEIEAIMAALHSTRWNRKEAAALLKIDYKALLYKMKKLGVEVKPATFAAGAESPRTATAAFGD
jgi:DNA-binding NtrC family response regulator